MRASELPSLPAGWYSSDVVTGGVDLRVEAPRRKYFAAGVAVLAILAGWRTFANWEPGARGSAAPWLIITLLLSLLALWCALADEVWHVENNSLVHRVGIGPFASSRQYRDAELAIMLRSSTQYNIPYYQLYAVVNGKSGFLMERGENELRQLANFISFHTGWPIRPSLAAAPFGKPKL